jgi:hypothetical protein
VIVAVDRLAIDGTVALQDPDILRCARHRDLCSRSAVWLAAWPRWRRGCSGKDPIVGVHHYLTDLSGGSSGASSTHWAIE